MTSEKDDLAKFLAEYRTWRCLVRKKFGMSSSSDVMESNGFNLFSRKRRIVKQGLGHLFITSISIHSSVKPIGPPLYHFKGTALMWRDGRAVSVWNGKSEVQFPVSKDKLVQRQPTVAKFLHKDCVARRRNDAEIDLVNTKHALALHCVTFGNNFLFLIRNCAESYMFSREH